MIQETPGVIGRMFRRGGFYRIFPLLALLGVMTGCETGAPSGRPASQRSSAQLETLPIPQAPTLQAARDAVETNPPVQPTTSIQTAPAVVESAATASASANAAGESRGPYWVDWQQWREAHGNRKIEVIPGSKRVLWEGTPVYLGFEPRLIDHRVEVLRRDIEKTFTPLLETGRVVPEVRRIVIDPGHGGTNSGTRIITGSQFEKQFTLDWALRLAALLQARGWDVSLTRTNDASLDLPGRIESADRAGAALFVSLHFNGAFPNTEVRGLETYCLTPKGLPSTVTRDFADDASQEWPNNAFDNPNLRLALRIHRSLIQKTGAVDRGVRRARFMGVLRGQKRPAILIEGGFLSNPAEASQIATAAYRQRLAEAVASALDEPEHADRR